MLLWCELDFFITNKIKAARKGCLLLTERFTQAGQSTYCSSNDSMLYKIIAVLLHSLWPHYVEHLSTQTNTIIINLCPEGSQEFQLSQCRGKSDTQFSWLAQVFGQKYFKFFVTVPFNAIPPLILCCCIQTSKFSHIMRCPMSVQKRWTQNND